MPAAPTLSSATIFAVGKTLGAFTGQTNQGGEDFFVKRLEVTSDPVVLLQALINFVNDADLQHGIRNSLVSKLTGALNKLNDNNPNNDGAAVNMIEAFLEAVNAQRGKKIPEDVADRMLTEAHTILDLLNSA
jgi:hypothetical protein